MLGLLTSEDTMSAVIFQIARHKAKRAVEAELKEAGIRVTTFPYCELRTRANAYFSAHRAELVEQATQAVMRSPQLRKMHEQEERLRAKLTSGAQKQSEPKSTTSVVHISGAK